MFPGRWKLFPLSYWNRGKRKGRITILSAGPVGHQVPGGYMDPKATLPAGRTYLAPMQNLAVGMVVQFTPIA